MKTLSLSKPLVVVQGKNEILEKSARNIPYTKVLRVEGLNVYDVMRHEQLVVTVDALAENRRGIVIMNQYDVIVRPIVTEKSSLLKDGRESVCLRGGEDGEQDRDRQGGGAALQGEGALGAGHEHGGQEETPRESTRASGPTGERPSSRSVRRTKFLSLKVRDGSKRI